MKSIKAFYTFRSICTALMAFSAATSSADGLLESASRLIQPKDSYMGPVASRIAKFKEDFVVGGMSFSADGTRLAINPMAIGEDIHIRDWADHGRIIKVLHKEAAAGTGNAINFSPDGRFLAAGNDTEREGDKYRVIRVWDIQSMSVVQDLGDNQGASGSSMGMAFTPDSKILIWTADRVGGPGDYVIAQRTDTWAKVWGISNPPLRASNLALSPDGALFAVAGTEFEKAEIGLSNNNKILIFEVATARLLRVIDHAFPSDSLLESLAWSSDGKSIALGVRLPDNASIDSAAVKIFNVRTGDVQVEERRAAIADVRSIAYSSDGRFLVEGHIDGKFQIWDGHHTRLLQEIRIGEMSGSAICMAYDGRLFAVANDRDISVWQFKREVQ